MSGKSSATRVPRRTDLGSALASAAAESLAILHADREHFARTDEPAMAAVLAFLAKHLFKGGVTAAAAARVAGSNERSISRRMRAYSGQSLSGYMAALQFEAATRWLQADPEIGIEVVAARVGLSAWRLRRLCRDWLGQTPTSCRLPAAGFNPEAAATWQRVARGEMARDEQQELADYVRATWPAAYEAATYAETAPSPLLATGNPSVLNGAKPARIVDCAALVHSFAEHQLWPLIAELPFESQRLVVQRYAFSSTELFDLLRMKSREEGRRDPQRGIELAELALLSLEASASVLVERIHELRALGWAWIGNANRLALDFPRAEESFEAAVAELALVKDWENSGAAGDVYALKGSLRTFQRRFKEALELLDSSVLIFKRIGNRWRQTEELMSRAAAASYAGWSEMAISDLTMALGIVNELKAEDLKLKVVISLGMALVNSGNFEGGKAIVKDVDRRLCQSVNPMLLHQLQWIEGIAGHGLGNHDLAEEEYIASRTGFEDQGQAFYTAFVDLDLAILYTEMHRPAAAARNSAAALRFFEALMLGRETMVSLGLLKDAIYRKDVTEAVLRELRSSLRADPLVALLKKAEPGPNSPGHKIILGH